jgi:hypothetical protein
MELYDLRTDPDEQRDVSRAQPKRVLELLDELDVRPLYRQAELIRRFRESGEIEDLTARLDAFHQEELLDYVLDQVPSSPPAAVQKQLGALHARPGLSKRLQSRIAELVPEGVEPRRRAKKGGKSP